MQKVLVKKLRDEAILPYAGTKAAAGYDLFACLSGDRMVRIPPRHTVKIGTGLSFAIPEGYFGAIFARSGLAMRGLRPANCVGVIDSDYRGEIVVALHNDGSELCEISSGDRIAQMILLPSIMMTFELTDHLDETERGAGGFGSTGK